MPYDSPIPNTGQYAQALAMYCSDGRFARHVEDFLEHRFGLERVDRVAVPGGPARLVPSEDAPSPANLLSDMVDDVCFLIQAHELDHVVLIQHVDCGYYERRLGLVGEEAHERQIQDLHHAAKAIRDRVSVAEIDMYFLTMPSDDESVHFEPINLVVID